mmetsp:Transcript_20135/g.50177  ORF Transcript_20135/g.50177 Transcript_20135/m.50177 type:complete len:221 (+) Transcript_20135:969-1631(+)
MGRRHRAGPPPGAPRQLDGHRCRRILDGHLRQHGRGQCAGGTASWHRAPYAHGQGQGRCWLQRPGGRQEGGVQRTHEPGGTALSSDAPLANVAGVLLARRARAPCRAASASLSGGGGGGDSGGFLLDGGVQISATWPISSGGSEREIRAAAVAHATRATARGVVGVGRGENGAGASYTGVCCGCSVARACHHSGSAAVVETLYYADGGRAARPGAASTAA